MLPPSDCAEDHHDRHVRQARILERVFDEENRFLLAGRQLIRSSFQREGYEKPFACGSAALVVGITIKLARALWIGPVVIVLALLKKGKVRIKWPWFILLWLP